jgi:hypothetical protein
MSGYFFPPPPPPPPSAHPQPPQPIQSSQTPPNATPYSRRGGVTSGYGRGRGNYHGNGNAPYGQAAYQNPGYQNMRGNYQRGGSSRGHHAYPGPQGHSNNAPNYPKNTHQPSWPASQQHGVNPGFSPWMGPGNSNPHSFQPNALTPNMPHYQQAYPQPAQSSFPPNQAQYPMPVVANQTMAPPPLRLGFSDGSNSIVELTPPQNTFAHKKRKRDNENLPHNFRRGPGSSGPPHQRQRTQNVTRVHSSPSVPAFGFTDVPGHPSFVRHPKGNAKKKNKKRNPNHLGLTPSGNVYEPSDEDVDEEEAFRAAGNRFGNSYNRCVTNIY